MFWIILQGFLAVAVGLIVCSIAVGISGLVLLGIMGALRTSSEARR